MVGARLEDPQLHIAGVIVSIHIVGILALGFDLTFPRVLVAILVGGAVDVVLT